MFWSYCFCANNDTFYRMKIINTNQSIKVPDEIDVSVKSRVVTVKGPRGTLTKSFKHLALDISMPNKKTVRVEKWFGKRKELAAVRTVCSHITNLFTGVTKVRKMLFVDYVRQFWMYVSKTTLQVKWCMNVQCGNREIYVLSPKNISSNKSYLVISLLKHCFHGIFANIVRRENSFPYFYTVCDKVVCRQALPCR